MSARKTLVIVVAAVLAACALPASAQTTLEIYGWKPTLEATARKTAGSIATDVDFKSDLGLKDKQFESYALSWPSGRHSFMSVGYEQVTFSADHVMTRTIIYNGQPYTVGTRVQTELAMKSGRLRWGWEFLGSPDGKVGLGPMLEIATFSFDGKLRAPELQPVVEESGKFSVAIPAVGIAFDLKPIDELRLYARGAYMKVNNKGRYENAEAGVTVRPAPYVGLVAGYRHLRVRAEDAPDFADLKLQGPYLALFFTF